jgi:hypothetical protein
MKRLAAVLGAAFLCALPAFGQGTTPNLQLTLPNFAAPNWNIFLNSNFSTLDNAIGKLQAPLNGPFSGTTVYAKGDQVTYQGSVWQSKINSNFNNTPAVGSSAWSLYFNIFLTPLFNTGSPSVSCAPANEGQAYYDTSTSPKTPYVCHNSAWGAAGAPGATFPTSGLVFATSPTTSQTATPANIAGVEINASGCNVAGSTWSPSANSGAGGCATGSPSNAISLQGVAVTTTAPPPRTSLIFTGFADNSYSPGKPLASELDDTQAQPNTTIEVPCSSFTSIAGQVDCAQRHLQLQNAGVESATVTQLPTPTYMWVAGQVPSSVTGGTGCVPADSLGRAAWSSGTSYVAGNVVSSSGHSWIANVAVSSGGSAPSEGTNWHQLSGNFMTVSLLSVVGNATLTGSATGTAPCSSSHVATTEGGMISSGNNYNSTSPDHGAGSYTGFTAASGSVATLGTTTTVLRDCHRPNPFFHTTAGGSLSVVGNTDFKSNEWYFSLASTAVHAANHQVGAFGASAVTTVSAPMPASNQYFGNITSFPGSYPGDFCQWLFYDTGLGGLGGTTGAPVVAGAFNDGVMGSTTTLAAPLSTATALIYGSTSFGQDSGSLTIWTGAAAGQMFNQTLRSQAWNNGMGSNIFQNYIMPTWAQLNKVYPNPTPIALGGDSIANVTAQAYPATSAAFTDAGGNYTLSLPAWVRTSPFTAYEVSVTSNSVPVKSPPYVCFRSQQGSGALLSLQDIGPTLRFVGYDIDGVYGGYMSPSSYGTTYRCIALPSGTTHKIRFYNGTTIASVYTSANVYQSATPIGGGPFVDAIGVPKGYTIKINHPATPTTLTYVYGHSVAAGHGTSNGPAYNQGSPTNSSWFMMSKKLGLFGGGAGSYAAGTSDAICDCFGSRLLWNDFGTSVGATSYMTAIKNAQPGITQILQEAVINDRFHASANNECLVPSASNVNSFMAAEANFVNSAHVAFPTDPIYISSDILQTSANEASLDGCNYTSGTVTNLNTILALGTLASEPTAASCTTSGCNYAAWRRVLYNSVQNPTNSTVQLYYSLTNPTAGVSHGLDWTGCMTQAMIGSDNIHPTVLGMVGIAGCNATTFGTSGNIVPPL